MCYRSAVVQTEGRSYRIVERLGEGAFGAVYLAETVGGGLARRVAIKVPHPDKVNVPGLVGRLRDEARLLALIRHRAIVRVDDLVELDGNWSVIMEYVEGADIGELLDDGPVPARAALAVAEEVCNALHAAWNQPGPDGPPLRLLHRDIKPSNLRLTPAGEVKILDFGVARAEFASREADDTGAVFGTTAYLAPERYKGEDTQAGDVYALGVTLFEMLTGVLPGKSAMDADRQPPGRLCAAQWRWIGDVHPQLQALLASMLAAEPGARPAPRDCARSLHELRLLVGGETVEDWSERVVAAHLEQRRQRAKVDDRSGSLLIERPTTSAARPTPAPPPRPRGLLVGLGLAAALAVGVAVVVASRAMAPAEPEPAARFGGALATVPVADDRFAALAAGGGPPPAAPPPAAPAEAAPAEPPASASARRSTRAVADPEEVRIVPRAEADPAAPPVPEPAPENLSPASATPSVGAPVAVTPVAPAVAAPAVAEVVVPSDSGRVKVLGDASPVVLVGASGRVSPGVVPAGTYRVEATLADGGQLTLDGVSVRAGVTTVVRCYQQFRRCSAEVGE